ncbi:hypothetical protein FOA52_014818 [Chlamydomonas sp. UWO 241]|nr:hypothetical protein FOA52_014818 [Chlamydomonas sp. UWO 241]
MSDGAQFSGTDQEGRVYQAPSELWEENKDGDGSHENWYKKAVAYWDQQEPTYNGVLGGFGFVSEIDIRDSKALLEKVMKPALDEVARGARSLAVLDCGAGVGRVTNELLLFLFQEVDLLEPSKPLLECARKHLTSGKVAGVPAGHRAVNFYCTGLQEHVFETGRYDVIWIQWCLLYLTDADVPVMLERAAAGLKPGGFVVFKENVCKEGFVVDNDDSSLTRSNSYLLDLINRSGWTLLQSAKQKNFPKDLFDVRMYVIKPRAAA